MLTSPAAAAAPRLRGHIWGALWAWTLLWACVHSVRPAGSWHYFALGGRLLFGDDRGEGLDLYAGHPDLQIGPLTFLVARPLHYLDAWQGCGVGLVLMTALGPLLLAALWRLVPEPYDEPGRLLAAGVIFLPVWTELSTHAGHLDDVLALTCGVLAMHARRHPVVAGLLVAAAADAKPWAVAFLPLLLGAGRLRALAACAAGLAVAWLPFVIYDPHTLTAARFTIENAKSSSLRVLGFTGPRTPSWDRPAQALLGCALGAAAVLRGRWPAVILLATGARVLLDPEVYGYYTAGVLLGAVAYDLIASRSRWPWATIAGVVMLYLARFAFPGGLVTLQELGVLRAAYVIGVAVVVVAT